MLTSWVQDGKKIKSGQPYFELLTTELVATEERVLNVSRFLPAIRCAFAFALRLLTAAS